jgi:hypothetical protein
MEKENGRGETGCRLAGKKISNRFEPTKYTRGYL